MEIRKINISEPSTGEEEWQAVKNPIMSGWLTQGPEVAKLEETFAKRHESKHGIATTSCTTALHLILAAMGIKPGDEVIVPAFTWIATANVVKYCGGTPVFVDIDEFTFNMNPDLLKEKITEKTKAIIAVHLFGLTVDMDAILKVANGIPVIEDAACAAGAKYKNKSSGSLGLAGAFSFHPRKSITCGEGGMITTNDDHLADLMNQLRNHGATISEEQRHRGAKPYLLPDFNLLGYNFRMTDLQGAVANVQMTKLDRFISQRNDWARFYTEELGEIQWIRPPVVPDYASHGWQAYVTMIDESKAPAGRNEIMEKLQAKGISTRPGTHAVHMQNYYKQLLNGSDDDFPVSQKCNNQSMALPLHNKMTKDDYEYVVKALKEI